MKFDFYSCIGQIYYSCSFGNEKFSLFHTSKLVCSNFLLDYDNVYLIDSIASFNESLQLSTQGTKRNLTNENSVALWHEKLTHISR